MQPSRRWPDNLRKTGFHMHVDVFQIEIFGYSVRFILLGNLVQTVDDLCRIFRLDDPPLRQHGHMSQARADVVPP